MKSNENSDRGQLPNSGVVIAIVGLSVAAIITAFVLPVAVDAIEGPTNRTVNQTNGEDVQLTGELNATLTGVFPVAGDSNYNVTIYDNSSDRESQTVNVEANPDKTSQITLDGNEIVINGTENGNTTGGDTYAVAEFSYPPDAGWSDSASSIWGLMGLALVLTVMVFIAGVATDGMDSM